MDKIVKRLLIAEDSFQWQKFHESLLCNYDKLKIDFVIVDSARDSLKLVQKNLDNPFDLILSDLQMEQDFLPEFAGEWFLKNVKTFSSYRKTPLVIVSAAYNISFIASNLGVGYLSKRSLVNNPDLYYFMLDEKLL